MSPAVGAAGRRADEEVAAALLDDPSEDLAAPRGAFIVARCGEAVLGCAGLRVLADGVGCAKVPAFNNGPYAKALRATTGQPDAQGR